MSKIDPESYTLARPSQNQRTQAAHRRELLWQIVLPLVLSILVLVGLAVVVALSGVGDASRWADISLIWLLLPLLLLSLVPLVAVVAMIVLISRLIGRLPGLAVQLQQIFEQVEGIMNRVADRTSEPVIKLRSAVAALRALRKG